MSHDPRLNSTQLKTQPNSSLSQFFTIENPNPPSASIIKLLPLTHLASSPLSFSLQNRSPSLRLWFAALHFAFSSQPFTSPSQNLRSDLHFSTALPVVFLPQSPTHFPLTVDTQLRSTSSKLVLLYDLQLRICNLPLHQFAHFRSVDPAWT